MKRWQVTYLGKPFLLYGNTPEEIRNKYSNTIDSGSDIVLLSYPQELFDTLTQLQVIYIDNKSREYRQVNLGYDYCIYRISKDKTDGNYYDFVQYRISGNRLVEPCLWSACTAQDFVNWYLKPVPDKICGWLLSLKEVKKLCGKVKFKVGKVNVWKDSDGYYYIGWQPDWSKYRKEEYKTMSEHRETAVLVCFTEGIYGGYKHKWFISEDAWLDYWKKISEEQPSYARTLDYTIEKRGYRKLPVEDRKLICRLRYINLERELQTEPPDVVSQMWARYNSGFIGDNDGLFTDIVKKICENIINIR
jgi:hypothetical protein